MKIKLPLSIISKVTTLADNTVRITLDCQEMNSERMAEIFTAKQSGELVQIEVDQEAGEKTPSARLRAVMYRLWEIGNKEITFEQFYKTHIERIIEKYKSLIN
jgi:hypothetical protein